MCSNASCHQNGGCSKKSFTHDQVPYMGPVMLPAYIKRTRFVAFLLTDEYYNPFESKALLAYISRHAMAK
jgi:hypothetical protein